MSKRDELIKKYGTDIQDKFNQVPDMGLLKQVTIGLGPSIYKNDASTVSAGSDSELKTVKENFLIKKLGLADSPKLMEAIKSVMEQYGKSNRTKYRAVVYYMLVKHFDKGSAYD